MEYLETLLADNGATGAATIDLSVPACDDGDLLLMHVGARGGTGGTLTLPSGWTQLQNRTNGTVTSHLTCYRLANSEPSSYTVTISTSQQAVGAITRYAGTRPSSPLEQNGSASASVTSASLSAIGVTVGWYSELETVFYTHGTGDTFDTPPTGLNERYQMQSAAATDTDRVTIAMYDLFATVPGNAGSRTLTANVSAAWVAHQAIWYPDKVETDATLRRAFVGQRRNY